MNYSVPLTVDVDITNRCNFSCIHCNKLPNTITTELTQAQLRRLFDELYDLGIAEVSLGGGEPLIRKDWFGLLSHVCSKPGWSVWLNTNGVLWRHGDIVRVKRLKYSPKIAVSLDGHTPMTYSELRRDINGKPAFSAFPKVIHTIQSMKEANLEICVNFVVTDRTANWIFDTIRLAERLKVDSFLIIRLMTYNSLSENDIPSLSYQTWKEVLQKVAQRKCLEGGFFNRVLVSVSSPWELLLPLLEFDIELDEIYKLWRYQSPLMFPHLRTIHNVGCHAGVSYCCISADGMVTPCSTISSKYKQMQCGNILEEPFEQIWAKSPVINSLRDMKLDDLQDSKCGVCTLRDICGGGCRARGFFASGSMMGPDTECPLNSWRNDYE